MVEARLESRPIDTLRTGIRRDPLVWLAVLVLALIYLFTASRYDIFRNELYFIVCGRHPAFGYADLPPLAPLAAAATQLFGINVFLLRLPAIKSEFDSQEILPDTFELLNDDLNHVLPAQEGFKSRECKLAAGGE